MKSELIIQLAFRLWREKYGQDLVEYAMLTGFMALAAGVVLPPAAVQSIGTIYSRVDSVLVALALQ